MRPAEDSGASAGAVTGPADAPVPVPAVADPADTSAVPQPLPDVPAMVADPGPGTASPAPPVAGVAGQTGAHEAVPAAPADAERDRGPAEPVPTETAAGGVGPAATGLRRPEPRRQRRPGTAAPAGAVAFVPVTTAATAVAGPAAVRTDAPAGDLPAPRPRSRPTTPAGPSLAPPPLAPPVRPAVTAGDVAALLLISLGAFVAPVLAPVLGLLLLWRSHGWRRTDKGAVTALLALPIVGALGVVAVSWFLDVWRF